MLENLFTAKSGSDFKKLQIVFLSNSKKKHYYVLLTPCINIRIELDTNQSEWIYTQK
jgi:hypothetical protein